jgi:hypothetical protein
MTMQETLQAARTVALQHQANVQLRLDNVIRHGGPVREEQEKPLTAELNQAKAAVAALDEQLALLPPPASTDAATTGDATNAS